MRVLSLFEKHDNDKDLKWWQESNEGLRKSYIITCTGPDGLAMW